MKSVITNSIVKEDNITATISKGYTFGATETVTNTKLHTLVDSATISGIVNADIDGAADIDSTKIDLSSSGYLATGTPTATITGDWTFEGQTNIDSLTASLATISVLYADSCNASTATIAYADIASLATLANLDVVNINGSVAETTLGTWVDKSGSYGAQQASTDGFICATAYGGDGNSVVRGYTDAANPPTTVRANNSAYFGTSYYSIMFPVKSGDYWKVTSSRSPTVYWIPLGT